MRVTWIQPEDLVGHELRQAREEGKDVDAIEAPLARRRRRARARRAARRRRPRRPSCGRSRSTLLDELAGAAAAARRPRARGLRRDPRRGRPGAGADPVDVAARIEGAWLGRAAGCVLGKPVEGLPREGDPRARPGRGQLAGLGLVHRARRPGRRARALAVEPRERADEPRREHRRRARGRRPQLHDARRRAARALRPRLRRARRREALARLPAARPDLHGRARRDAEPPARRCCRRRRRRTATRSASGSARACASTSTAGPPRGDPVRAARMAWEDARVSHTANGVYAAMFMAAVHAASLTESSSAAAADAGLSVVPGYSRLAEAILDARELARQLEWEAVVDELVRRGTASCTGCTRSTTPRSSPRRSTRSTATSPAAIGAVVQGGWDTDTNGAAVGSVLGALAGPAGIDGALDGAAEEPHRELAARLRREHDRRARAAHARRRAHAGRRAV